MAAAPLGYLRTGVWQTMGQRAISDLLELRIRRARRPGRLKAGCFRTLNMLNTSIIARCEVRDADSPILWPDAGQTPASAAHQRPLNRGAALWCAADAVA